MKPTRIAFQGFGAFPGREEVDLVRVGREGLFLIRGETGAGKTTLLDAMCYALYGTSSSGISRDPGKGSFESMRSRYLSPADRKTVTWVELELEKNGERYRFRRELRPRPRSAGFDSVHLFDRWNGESWMPVLANATDTKVTEQAKLLTGLDADQFRQIIILPQGRFEQLLTSSSEDKERILSTIFAADAWEKAVERLREETNEQKRGLQERKTRIEGKLSAWGCANETELEAKLGEAERTLPGLTEEKGRAQTALEAANRALQAAAAELQMFTTLDQREAQAAALKAQSDIFRRKEEELRRCRRAEGIRSVWENIARQRKELDWYRTAAEEKRKKAGAAAAAGQAAQEAWNEHEGKRPKYERARQDVPLMEKAREAYAACSAHRKEAAEAAARLRQEEERVRISERENTAAKQQLTDAGNRSRQADERAGRIRELYMRNAAGRLAEELAEGIPCPVCGSIHHPRPAVLTGERVTDEQLEQAKKEQEAAISAFHRATKRLQETEEGLRVSGVRLASAQADAERIEQMLRADEKQLIEGIGDAMELEKSIGRTRKAISLFEEKETGLKKELERTAEEMNWTRGAAAEAERLSESAEAALRTEEREWVGAFSGAGFDTEDAFLNALPEPGQAESRSEEIERYRAACRHAEEELRQQRELTAGKTRPDLRSLEEMQRKTQGMRDEAVRRLTQAQEAVEQMKRLRQEIRQEQETLQKDETAWNRRNEFVRRLDNSSGMNLHRYVLAAMLDAVIQRANDLLENVHNGRFRLERSDTASGTKRKAGLELNVLDAGTSSIRGVKSLSGGEKFLVSLALAIGLNTVMQSQARGIRIEAIFVDEGFGSLDGNSIEDAMQMLQTIRMSHGMVGVISHIEALRNEIPVHIEVRKDVSRGSTLVLP